MGSTNGGSGGSNSSLADSTAESHSSQQAPPTRNYELRPSPSSSSTVQNTASMLADVQTLIQDLEQKNKALVAKMVQTEDHLLSKLFSVNDAHLMHVCFRSWCDARAKSKELECFASIEGLIAEDTNSYDHLLQQLEEERAKLLGHRVEPAELEMRLRDAEATIQSLGEVLGRCAALCNNYPHPNPEPVNEETHKFCRRELGVALLEIDRGLGSGNSTLVTPVQTVKIGANGASVPATFSMAVGSMVAASPASSNFRQGAVSPYTPSRPAASGSWQVAQGNPTPVQKVCNSPSMPLNLNAYAYTT